MTRRDWIEVVLMIPAAFLLLVALWILCAVIFALGPA